MILTDQEVERYARQVVMPEIGEVGQKKLLDAKVLILGAGGLGAPVIAGLAGAGVGHLTVIDDDVVELTNLNRQIVHSMDRLAMNKAESAALFSKALNPDIQVDTKTQRFCEENASMLIKSHDLALTAQTTLKHAIWQTESVTNITYLWCLPAQSEQMVRLPVLCQTQKKAPVYVASFRRQNLIMIRHRLVLLPAC